MTANGFSDDWEEEWQRRDSYTEWPWSTLVSYVMRHVDVDSVDSVLELGCGTGANIPFFLGLDVDYYAVEGSETAVEVVRDRFPEIRDQVVCGDFTTEFPDDGPFDLVVDRGSLTCNSTAAIERILGLVDEHLADGRRFVSIDNFSTDHSGFAGGTETADELTKRFEEGTFEGYGEIHFWTEEHIENVYDGFEICHLTHEMRDQVVPDEEFRQAWYHVVAET